jgi:ElaB/YqjD/DUF883 family membrane-anchored ribosome-binding protein
MTLAEPPPAPTSAPSAEQAAAGLRARLGKLYRELQTRKFLLRAFYLLGALGLLWLVLALSDRAASWQESAAFAVAAALLGAVSLTLAVLAIRLFTRRRGSLAEIALRVETRHPELRDALICATELSRKDPAQLQRVERALLESIPASIEGLDLRQAALTSRLRLRRLIPVGLICLALVAAALFTPLASKARFHAADLLAGRPSGLVVQPGSQEVPRSTDVEILTQVKRWQNSAEIEYRDAEGLHRFPLFDRNQGQLGFTLYGVEGNVRYRVRTPSLTGDWHELRPYDPPSIESRKIRVEPPAYTGLAPQDFNEFADLTAVAGSQIHVTVTTGAGPQPRVAFHLEAETPVEQPFEPGAKDREFTVTHLAKDSGNYHVSLSGEKGRLTRTDSHKLTVIPDQPPTIEVVEPGKDLQAGPDEEVNLVAKAVDDFGLGDVTLNMTIIGRDPMTGSVLSREESLKTPRERIVSVPTPLSDLNVGDGDVISYYFTTKDNRDPDPQEARTEVYFIEVIKAKTPQRQDGQPGQQQQQVEVRSLIEGLKKNLRQNLGLQTRETNGQAIPEDYQALESGMADLRTSGQKKLKEIVDFIGLEGGNDLIDRFTDSVNKMGDAEKLLGKKELKSAVPPTQTALRALLQIEQELIQNTMNQQASESQASNLGEQNQPPQPPERQQSPEEIRKELQGLSQEVEKLAREQSRLNQQLSQAAKSGSALSGQQQQRMQSRQEEIGQRTEDAAKRLEKFSDAGEMRQGLAQARQEMKQSNEAMGEGDAAGAQPFGERARDELGAVADSLQGILQQQGQQRAAQAAQQAGALAQAQSEAAQASKQAGSSGQKGEQATQQSEQLREQQSDLKEQYDALQKEMQGLASELEKQSPNAARKMSEAAAKTAQQGTGGDMEKANNALLYQRFDRAAQLQEQAAGELGELAKDLADVAGTPGQISEEQMAQAMSELQKSQARMEALAAEARQQAQEGKGKQPGQEGLPQQGQPGQEGKPGSEGKTSQAKADELSKEIGRQQGLAGKNLQNLGQRMGDQGFSELGQNLQASEGEGGKSGEGNLAAAEETLQALETAMQMLRDRMLLSDTRERARLNVDSIPPPEKYRRLVEEYFKKLGTAGDQQAR